MLNNKLTVEYVDKMGCDLTVTNAARVSFGSESQIITEKDIKLINFLAREQHYSPFEHCTLTLKIVCPMPISKQIMRHRTFSYNEISRRYTDKDLAVFLPDVWREQSANNKQCSEGEVEAQELAKLTYSRAAKAAMEAYTSLLNLGVSREQARFALPQGLQTEFYMTGNLRNWASFIKLRDAHDAQGEVQEIGQRVKEIVLQEFPHSAKALLYGQEKTSAGE